MVNIGIDLHKTQFTICVRGQEGNAFGKYPTTEEGYTAFIQRTAEWRGTGEEVRLGVESTGNTRYFRDKMECAGMKVVVINTLKLKVVTESVKKTDKHDAATIAEFLEKDMLPESKLCSRESEQLRRLLKARGALVRTEVVVKNQIHGLITALGMEDIKGSLQSKRGRKQILDALRQCENGLVAGPLFETIERLEENINSIEEVIRGLVEGDRVVELLLTIPGCGEIGAWTIRAWTDDIGRFISPKKYVSYAGLAPWVQDSNETIHHGKITKRGPKELRTALVQVVMGWRRMKQKTLAWRLMERYEMMKKNKGSGKAIIATARKVAVIVWHMLSNEVAFDVGQMTSVKPSKKSDAVKESVKVVEEAEAVAEEKPAVLEKKPVIIKKNDTNKGKEKTGVARKKMKKVG